MKHAKGLLTPARALHRVLLLSLANATSKTFTATSTSTSTSTSILLHRAWPPSPTSPQAPCQRTIRRGFSSTAAPQRFPRNENIPYRWVQVADTSGTLSAPQRIEDVMASLSSKHNLVMVAPPPPPPPSPPGAPPVLQPSAAICRIVDTVGEAKAAKAAEREAKQLAQQSKTLEINWSIAPHDLSHKMKRLEGFLRKRMRVEIILARKKGTRKATAEETHALAEKIREAVTSVPNASEYRRPDGNVGGVLRMFFEGSQGGKKVKEGEDKEGEEG